jgi:hypothetical protein
LLAGFQVDGSITQCEVLELLKFLVSRLPKLPQEFLSEKDPSGFFQRIYFKDVLLSQNELVLKI